MHLRQHLGIELGIVYLVSRVDSPSHLHHHVPPRTRRVSQWRVAVRRGTESGITPCLLYLVLVHLAVCHARFLQHMFQKSRLPLAYLVKLVEVYEAEACQRPLSVALVREVEAVSIVRHQLWRHESPAEC